MSLWMFWPIILSVVSNSFYHICAKSTPSEVNPFASLTVTYLVSAAMSALCYFALRKDGTFVQELGRLNWVTVAFGIAIVGLEVGAIYLYRVGWKINTGYMVQSIVVAMALVLVGRLVFHEAITASKLIGIAICIVGLCFINK